MGPRLFTRGAELSFAPLGRKVRPRLLHRDSASADIGADGQTKIVMPVRGRLRLHYKGGSVTMSTAGSASGWALSPKLQWAVVTDVKRQLYVFGIPGGKLIRKLVMPPCGQCKEQLRNRHATSPLVFHTASKVVFHNNCQLYMLDLADGQATPQPFGLRACMRAHTRGGSADGQVWWSGKATRKFGATSDEKFLELWSTQVASGNTRSVLKTSKKHAALHPRAAPNGKRICYQRINPRSKPLPRGVFLPEPRLLECIRLADMRLEHLSEATDLAGWWSFGPAGNKLVYGVLHGRYSQNEEVEIRLVDLTAGSWRKLVRLPYKQATGYQIMPGGQRVVVSGHGVVLFDVGRGQSLRLLPTSSETWFAHFIAGNTNAFAMGIERGASRDLHLFQLPK